MLRCCSVWFLGVLVSLSLVSWNNLASAGERPAGKAIALEVDASQITRKIVHAQLEIPVSSGPLTLFYPKWIPGKHSPAGPIADLAGLKISAGHKAIPWTRDEVDGYALHCRVPVGVDRITVKLDYLLSGSGIGKPAVSAKLAVLSWDQVLLYPKGKPAEEIPFQARLKLPKGWDYGTSLAGKKAPTKTGNWVRFEPVSLVTLIDSPVLCGQYLKKIALAPDIQPPHYLVLAGDSERAIELPIDLKHGYDRLVKEALALFGSHHYRSYTFLLALSDYVPHGGLEHHESSDNRLPENALHDSALVKSAASLLPHEMVHSWNGKYRRPASMVTRDFQEPHRTKMLWVYEGLTSYLDDMLAARCGLRTLKQTRDALASIADRMNNQKGRNWRPLEDTTVGAHVIYRAGAGWRSWRRSLDYYDEGSLIWLEVDARIRKITRGKKSLDDFCRLFFGGKNSIPTVKGYDFADLCNALNKVAPYDWKGLLRRRVSLPTKTAPLEGLHLSGWKLSYTEDPNAMQAAREKTRHYIDYSSSIGLVLSGDGKVRDVIQGTAADKAGIGPGMKLLGIHSRRWSPELLKSAIAATKKGKKLILLMENDEFFRTFTLNYTGGLRYPTLERTSLSDRDFLEEIYAPRVKEE